MIDNEITLNAINDSIRKWRKIVFIGLSDTTNIRCPLCAVYNDNCYNGWSEKRFSEACPIFYFTRSDFCNNTSFYGTSVWAKSRGYYATGQNWIADNHMLSELYDVRRKFIESTYNGEYR